MNHRFGYSNSTDSGTASPRRSLLAAAVLAGVTTLAFANVAQAADDGHPDLERITFYGIIDIGVAYQSHGTPLSQDWGNGLNYLIAKGSNKSITSIAPSGLGQSRLGVKGVEAIKR